MCTLHGALGATFICSMWWSGLSDCAGLKYGPFPGCCPPPHLLPVHPAPPPPPHGHLDPPPPVVAVKVRVPACAHPGQDLVYHIHIENCSAGVAHHVIVRNPV